MLLVGSGVPWILEGHVELGHSVFLAIIAIMLLLSLGYHTINAKHRDTPSNNGAPQDVKALFRVVERGNLAWTYRLIAMGADVNVRNDAGQTPLMFAAEKGYADMVQVLIQHGANPKLANNQGESAMTIALMKGYTRIAESLEMAAASYLSEQGEGRD
jgi:ankyrin repeat protein